MYTILVGVAFVLLLLFIFIIIGTTASRSAGKKAGQILQRLEMKYEEFMDRSLARFIIDDIEKRLDEGKLREDILTLIKPEVEALVALINATEMMDIGIKYQSTYFNNVSVQLENLFDVHYKSKDEPLADEHRQKLIESIVDSINADLIKRKVDLGI